MKAERKEEKDFIPVILTLETQEEVDKIYALLNFIPISETIQTYDWEKSLEKYVSTEYDKYHFKLNKKFK